MHAAIIAKAIAEHPRDIPPPRVRIVTSSGTSGLAIHAAGIQTALDRAGVNAWLCGYNQRSGHAEVNILFSWAAKGRDGDHNVAMCMTEIDPCGAPTVQALNQLDAVMTPSTFCKRIFEESGVTVPIYVVPHYAELEPIREEQHRASFRFLLVFAWNGPGGAHKDPRTLIQAYLEAFRDSRDVELVLKCPAPELAALVEELQATDLPRITIIRDELSRDGMSALYASCDCYVSPHHAEGIGLPLLEAMAIGLPCIATGYGGNVDFMSDGNSFLLEYDLIPGYQLGPGYAVGTGSSKWAQASREQLQVYMKYVANNPHAAHVLGLRGQEHIAKNFTSKKTATAVLKALEEILQYDAKPQRS
jgi:glycosyltransferase involved in cell wall biosynthesis